MRYLACFGAVVGIGIAGAVGLSLLTDWYFRITHDHVTGDGQYGMIFFYVTGPLGWLMGSLMGLLLVSVIIKQPNRILWLGSILVVLGLLISPLLGMLPFGVIGYFSK